MMKHTAFFGDGEKTFTLTTDMILELERTTGSGIMALHSRFMAMAAQFHDLTEVIRVGLIGGGMSPEEAHKLVSIYGRSMLITDLYLLAFDILDARYSGKPDTPIVVDPDLLPDGSQVRQATLIRYAAATGDMSAAINAGLEQVAE